MDALFSRMVHPFFFRKEVKVIKFLLFLIIVYGYCEKKYEVDLDGNIQTIGTVSISTTIKVGVYPLTIERVAPQIYIMNSAGKYPFAISVPETTEPKAFNIVEWGVKKWISLAPFDGKVYIYSPISLGNKYRYLYDDGSSISVSTNVRVAGKLEVDKKTYFYDNVFFNNPFGFDDTIYISSTSGRIKVNPALETSSIYCSTVSCFRINVDTSGAEIKAVNSELYLTDMYSPVIRFGKYSGKGYLSEKEDYSITFRSLIVGATIYIEPILVVPVMKTTEVASLKGNVYIEKTDGLGLIHQWKFTPTGTDDTKGIEGNIAWDDNYLYIKTGAGWKRVPLSTW